ncbi:MAG: methyltransferase domain-containing protein [Deinococcales bacterium]
MDDKASAKLCEYHRGILPARGLILDLMAAQDSHLYPSSIAPQCLQVIGLGLAERTLKANPLLKSYLLHDLNVHPKLPFADACFDGIICTCGIEYLIQPQELFAEVARVLKTGAPFMISFSERYEVLKAILIWRSGDEASHLRLVKHFFDNEPWLGPSQQKSFRPVEGDVLHCVWAYREKDPYHHDLHHQMSN